MNASILFSVLVYFKIDGDGISPLFFVKYEIAVIPS